MRGFPKQPQSAGSELRGSAVQQKAVPRRILPGASSSPDSSHQTLGLDLASDHSAGIVRGDLRRRKEDPANVTACPNLDPRSAPQRQQGSTLPRSGGSHLQRLERAEVNRNCEPGLRGRSAASGAQEPNPQAMNSWPWNRLSFSSAGKPSAESAGTSPPKHGKQAKPETRSNLIPEMDKTLSKTNPLEVGLMALRNSSHPQSSQFLQALERPIQIVNDLLDENQYLQKELNKSRALQERLQAHFKQLQQELQKRQSSKGVLEYQLVVTENQWLQQELQELKNTQGGLLADLQAENQELRQELEELRKGRIHERETSAEEIPVPQSIAFPVQVQSSGKTGGCEKQFLHDVAKLLNSHKISLQVEEYQEGSEHLLLLFSPIASRTGADIDSALNGLKSIRKVLLVLLHYKLKSNTKCYADTKTQVQHPALVGTVDAYFSIHDGFYHCQMNQDAVESVAATIMELTQDG